MDVTCPICKSNYSLIHEECIEYYELCTCNLEELESFYCGGCNFAFEVDLDELFEEEEEIELSGPTLDSLRNQTQLFDPVGLPAPQKPVVQPCRHEQKLVLLPNDVPIYCSSYKMHLEDPKMADYGLYADHCWRPVHRNEYINWPDFGLPADIDIALDQIWEAYDRSRYYEEKVQIGCIGGHGRTGTILGCMAIIGSDGQMTAEDAIKFTRSEYCHKAIETDLQEWMIEYAKWYWFADKGTPCPERPVVAVAKKPVATKTKGGGSCSVESHFGMILAGKQHCVNSTYCHFFNYDREKLEKEGFASVDKQKVLESYEFFKENCTKEKHIELLNKGATICEIEGYDCETWEQDMKDWSV